MGRTACTEPQCLYKGALKKMDSKITLLEHSALLDVHNVTGQHDRFYEREREKVTKQTKNKNIQHHELCCQNCMSPAYGIMTEKD